MVKDTIMQCAVGNTWKRHIDIDRRTSGRLQFAFPKDTSHFAAEGARRVNSRTLIVIASAAPEARLCDP